MTEDRLARLADRMEIRDLLTRYCRAVDRLDAGELNSVFTDDAVIEKSSGVSQQPGYVAGLIERHSTFPVAAHQITGVLVDFVDDDRAFAQSWGMAVERHAEDGVPDAVDLLYRVRYGDSLERRDGGWRIAHRVLVTDHVMKLQVAVGVAELTGTGLRMRRSPEDPIEQRRRAVVG